LNRIGPIVLALLFAGSLLAQQRPKVGVVLSGGGAKGLAHVGVLKVLEREGVPIDYITGTSMGSIVGGLYAVGYSATDLERIVNEINWEAIFSGNVLRSDLTFDNKVWDGRYMVTLPMRKGKIQLPSGIIGDQPILELLAFYTLPVHHLEDFHQLAIPFACIGADIVTGEAVVLDHGYLPEALRASMSLPSIYPPIKLEGHLLVDGGIVRNFPVQDVRKMGADIVIGVDVSAPLYKEKELDSFLKVQDQYASFRGAESNERQRQLCDVLIRPDITGISLLDFARTDEIIARGEKAAEQALPALRALVDSIGRAPERHFVPLPSRTDSIVITDITIEGLTKVDPKTLTKDVERKLPVRVTVGELERAIQRSYSTQFFDHVYYRLLPAEGGEHVLIKAREKSNSLFRFSLRYDSNRNAKILMNTLLRNIGVGNSYLNIDLGLGEQVSLNANYLTYWGFRYMGSSLQFHYTNTTADIFEVTQRVARMKLQSIYSEGQIGTLFSTKLAITLGARIEHSRINGEITADSVSFTETLMPLVNIIWLDTFDKSYFPHKGLSFFMRNELSLGSFIGKRQFRRHFGHFRGYLPVSSKISLLGEAMFGWKDGDLPPHYQFVLGGMDTPAMFLNEYAGIISFLGLKYQELIGPFAQFVQIGAQAELKSNLFLIFRANAGNTFSTWNKEFSLNRYQRGFGLTLGIWTPLGPVELTAMSSNRHRWLSHFNFGFKF